MVHETTPLDDGLLESVAQCLNAESVRALAGLRLPETAQPRLGLLADKANEGKLTPEEAREYERLIELEDILAVLRMKAERRMQLRGS